MTIIRPIVQHDVAQVSRLAHDMHAESKYARIPIDADCVDALAQSAISGYVTCFVAVTHDAEVVGFIVVEKGQYFFSKQSHATDLALYVKPKWRGTPAPLRLIKAAEAWATLVGCTAMTLGVSAPDDTSKVQHLYERLGYTPWGVVVRKDL